MAQRLGELDELKDSFLAKISHDLRNPLSAILGFGKMMMMGMQGPLTKDQMSSLEVITRNTRYLGDLIDNILDLTKLEAGKLELSPQETSLKDCSQAVVELMKVKADEFGVSLDYSRISGQTTLWADRQALQRILLNLVSNALKFTPQGGSVFIEWARHPDGDRVAVRDTGIGIPENKIGTLFQKFAQISETQNKVRVAKGTGLGLVICKELVEAHGGKIGVESRYRRGTTFFFILPPAPKSGLGRVVPEPAKIEAASDSLC
jgi:signal transduction histidine kinase